MDKKVIVSFLLCGIILGGFIIFQFKTDVPLTSSFPIDEISAREDLLKSLFDEQSYLKSRIVSLREQIDESQASWDLQTEHVNFDLLEKLKLRVGISRVSGSGLEITLDDSPLSERTIEGESFEIELVQASDIRDVVNILNAANADAISVNNQRVISTSAITSVGSTIFVNNSHIYPPFVIHAIGDSEIMIQRLSDRNALFDLYSRIENSRLVFKLLRKKIISVPIYNGELQDTYINLVGE